MFFWERKGRKKKHQKKDCFQQSEEAMGSGERVHWKKGRKGEEREKEERSNTYI